MNDVFLKLYTDEDVDVLVAAIIRSHGFSATTTQEAGNKSLSDKAQLEFAINNEIAILTHNRVDFEVLAQNCFDENLNHHGIIISYQHPPQEIARRLLVILNNLTADEIANQLIYI